MYTNDVIYLNGLDGKKQRGLKYGFSVLTTAIAPPVVPVARFTPPVWSPPVAPFYAAVYAEYSAYCELD